MLQLFQVFSVFSSSLKFAVHQKLGLGWLVLPLNMHCVAYFPPLRLLTLPSAVIIKGTRALFCQKVTATLTHAVKPPEKLSEMKWKAARPCHKARSCEGHRESLCLAAEKDLGEVEENL